MLSGANNTMRCIYAQLCGQLALQSHRIVSICVLLAFVLLGNLSSEAETSGLEELESARLSYERGDFSGAISAYETAIHQGLDNGYVYYNLGNSYYRTGKIGMAIWAYRCALLDIPRLSELQSNLSLARKQTQDLVEDGRRYSGVIELLAMPLRLLSRYELNILLIPIYTLGCLLFGAWLVVRRRGLLLASCYTVGVAAYLLYINFAGAYNRLGVPVLGGLFARDYVAGVITGNGVEVRSGNGGIYQVVFLLNEGTEVIAGETREDWIEVTVAESKRGWVRLEDIALVIP